MAHIGKLLTEEASIFAGTFALETNYPNYQILVGLRGSPIFNFPIFSEIRYLSDVIIPSSKLAWTSGSIRIDYAKIGSFLHDHPDFNYFLYSGSLDAISPVESYGEELNELRGLVKYTNFPAAGHDAFFTEPLIKQRLMQF